MKRILQLVLALASLTSASSWAQNHGPVEVAAAVKHDTLTSLRDTVPQPDGYKRWHERDEHRLPLPYTPPGQTDGALQSSAPRRPLVPTLQNSVDGVGDGFTGPDGTFTVDSAPPDTVGAVGATQYVQVVNTGLAVFDKTTKAATYGPVPTNTLWSGFGGQCEADNDGDAVVVYDHLANRWIVSQFAVATTPYLQCVAVSQTSDATGGWYRYAFSYASIFPDYPKMGVWPDAYYVTFNMFTSTFQGSRLCAYDRSAMLTGAAATQQCFQLSSSFGGVLPSDLDGATLPPANAPNYLLNFGSNSLNLWKFHVDWANTANTALTGPVNLSVAAFTPACGGGVCVIQPGTHQQLDSLGDRLMFRLAYRNFGDHESLVANHSVKVGTSKQNPYTGVRWYEIRSPGATPVVYQQSTFTPDTSFRWMGSIAMDVAGNMALGYSVSSDTVFPAIRYTGRLHDDPLSSMQAETSIIEGAGAQSGQNLDRWGDYSAMSVDPVDDCTFWFTTEYLQATGAFNWSTRIGSLKFDTCGAVTHTVTPSVGTGTGTINPSTPQTVVDGATRSFTLTPGTGYHIDTVGGSCGGSLNGSTYTTDPVTANCTVVANFAINTYTVTPSVNGGHGTIAPDTAQIVDYNTTPQFTLTPDAGYHIGSVGGTCGGSLNGATYTTNAVTANCTVIASFAINTYTVTPSVNGGHGTIAPNTAQVVNYNATPQFTLTPDAGYHINGVSGSCGGSLNGATYTTNAVTANCTVIASFAINTYTVTPSVSGGHGTIAPDTAQVVNYNATPQFTLTPDAGYHIDSVGGDCGGTLNGSIYTTAAVTANCAVVAAFALNPPTLEFTTQPADVLAGTTLGTIAVTMKDPFGNPIDDNGSTVDFSVTFCGGPISIGSAPTVHGVATLSTTQRFYTVLSPAPLLEVSATTGALTAQSTAFSVLANGDLAFADGFEACRL